MNGGDFAASSLSSKRCVQQYVFQGGNIYHYLPKAALRLPWVRMCDLLEIRKKPSSFFKRGYGSGLFTIQHAYSVLYGE